jgi:hypothetical protein
MNARGNGGGAPVTPVLLKTAAELPWPEDERIFYILGRDGLYVCRNHEFFRSCVPAKRGPSELAEQATFLTPRFPVIPRALFERAVGFFDRVAEQHGSEASVLLVWDRLEGRVRLVVPEQTATISRAWDGYRSPIGVHYAPPTDLSPDWVPFGDIHSHVHHPAYASSTDKTDETHAAGLHVVVGRIQREPPEIHVEAVVDGNRFVLDASDVIEGYEQRRMNVPRRWLERVQVETLTSTWWAGSAS